MKAMTPSSSRNLDLRLVTLSLLAAFASHATAAGITFTDQSAFLSALTGGATTYDFDSLPDFTPVTTQFSGVSFGGSAIIYAEQTHPSGGAFHTAPNVLLNSTPPNPITFTFSTPVDGIGFFNTSIQDREQLTLFGFGGAVLFTGELSEGSVNYLGYVSDQPIFSGSVVGIPPQTFGTIFIDTFSFGTVAQTPEPTSTTLLLCGAAFCLRRRSLRTYERNG